MQIVGDELERLALSNANPRDADLLGRSAFNRYYYAAYLITRNTLGRIDASWKRANHSDVPTILRLSLKGPAKAAIDRQQRGSLLTKDEGRRLLSKILTIGDELARLLEGAYDARCLADYEPEVVTIRTNNTIELKAYKLTTAKTWPRIANNLCAQILKIWREIGLAG